MSIYLATFGKLRYLGLTEIAEEDLAESRWVLLKTVRGLEMGLLGGQLSQEQEARYRAASMEENSEQTRGPESMLQEVEFVSNATAEDIENYYQCRSDEEEVLVRAREILLNHSMSMKLVDVEYMLDRKKLFFYFTSEQRVDFRAYVRDLARDFRTRIEMRQIGVRDEARVVKGIAPCGRPCCCSYWLHQFTPICIRMVKEQKLALNPTKISGICGRLMCCMAYEHEIYGDLWKRLPNPGSKIRTEQGNYVLDSVDLGTEHVRIRFPSGRVVSVSIDEFPDFRDAVTRGEEWGDDPAASSSRPTFAARRAVRSRSAERPSAQRPAPVRSGGGPREKISLDEHLARRGQNDHDADEHGVREPREGAGSSSRRRRGGQRAPEGGAEQRASRPQRAQNAQNVQKNQQPRPPRKPQRTQQSQQTQQTQQRSGARPAGGGQRDAGAPRPGGGDEGERRSRRRRRPHGHGPEAEASGGAPGRGEA